MRFLPRGENYAYATAKSMCALLKYGSGMPFYRFSRFQRNLGSLIPPSTQWDAVEDVADAATYFIRTIAHVYRVDRSAKNLSPELRLTRHQKLSLPIMEKLKR
jgi:hypothetical protein